MTPADDVLGYAAAGCVSPRFCIQSMRRLRLVALLSRALFIASACRVSLAWAPGLRLFLIPINLAGLRREVARRDLRKPAWRRATRRSAAGPASARVSRHPPDGAKPRPPARRRMRRSGGGDVEGTLGRATPR